MKLFLMVTIALFSLCSCGNKENKKNIPVSSTGNKDSNLVEDMNELPQGLSVKYLGLYTGKQESYFMRNSNGEEMVIRGEKVEVPACDYKFILKLNNLVTLQQINLSNNQKIVYEGSYQIVDDNENSVSISCAVSDGSGSSPNYTIQIDKVSKTAICFSDNEPEFTLEYGAEKREVDMHSTQSTANSDSIVAPMKIDAVQDSVN